MIEMSDLSVVMNVMCVMYNPISWGQCVFPARCKIRAIFCLSPLRHSAAILRSTCSGQDEDWSDPLARSTWPYLKLIKGKKYLRWVTVMLMHHIQATDLLQWPFVTSDRVLQLSRWLEWHFICFFRHRAAAVEVLVVRCWFILSKSSSDSSKSWY